MPHAKSAKDAKGDGKVNRGAPGQEWLDLVGFAWITISVKPPLGLRESAVGGFRIPFFPDRALIHGGEYIILRRLVSRAGGQRIRALREALALSCSSPGGHRGRR